MADISVSSDRVYEIQLQLQANQIAQLTRDLAIAHATTQELSERLQSSEQTQSELKQDNASEA